MTKPLFELLAAALSGKSYPPAYLGFVNSLAHPHDEVLYFCTSTLDALASDAFGTSKMICGGFMEYERSLEEYKRRLGDYIWEAVIDLVQLLPSRL